MWLLIGYYIFATRFWCHSYLNDFIINKSEIPDKNTSVAFFKKKSICVKKE